MTVPSFVKNPALATVAAFLLLLALAHGLGFSHGATLVTRTLAYALAAVSLSFLIGPSEYKSY